MTDSHRRGKRRPTLVEGFNNVPRILEEARRAVDDVTKAVQSQGGGEETPATPEGQKSGEARPKKRKAAPRKKSAKESGRQKKPSRPPAAEAQPAASGMAAGGQRGLTPCGIKVKHAIPGRIRLRLYKMLHNESLAEKLPSLLAAVPGVTSVEASTNTGSLLITYNPGELAAVKARRALAGVMQQFFPGLDIESLIKPMLGG
ncbi:MAG: HMA2 domain-containing protein [Desulfobaccales bacterium]